MAKKKIYKNPYKEAKNNENQQGQASNGKKKISFKAYAMGVSIVVGFAAFFTQNLIVCIVAICCFLIAAFFMGKEQYIFLGIGTLMALLISGLNSVNILYIIPLVWSLFYVALMVSGMFLIKKNNR